MARVDDLDNKPQIKTAVPRKAKRQDAKHRSSTAKARTKKRALKSVTVDVAGVTYIGWYWIENNRMFVTYLEQPKSEVFPCACCTSDGAAPSVRL